MKGVLPILSIAAKFAYDYRKDIKEGYEALKETVKKKMDELQPKSEAFKKGRILEQEPESLKAKPATPTKKPVKK